MEAIIHLKGKSRDVAQLARIILRAAKLFDTEAGFGSKSAWAAILENERNLTLSGVHPASDRLAPIAAGPPRCGERGLAVDATHHVTTDRATALTA
jgi:hypothetical protein